MTVGYYFRDMTQAQVNSKTFKVKLTVTNECGPTSNFSYFRIKPGCPSCERTIDNNPIAEMADINAPDTRVLTTYAYPNPATNEIAIAYNLPNESKVSLTVYDALGRVVTRPVSANVQSAGSQIHNLTISDFVNGLYFYTIETENGKVNGKFIKQ